MTVGAFVLEGFGPTTDVGTFVLLGFGVSSTAVAVPLAGGGWSFAIQDKYWRAQEKRYEKKKKQAKKKSSLAVDIVEEIAATQHVAGEALARLSLELERMNIREAAVYRDLLKLEMEMKERDDDEDALLMLH